MHEAPNADDLPAELVSALEAAPDAKSVFEKLPQSHRKEYARWIGEARKPETRLGRAEKAVGMILDKDRKRGSF